MKPAPMSEEQLHGYADGRLDAAARTTVANWLADRPDEQERVSAWREQGLLLHERYDIVLQEPLPARLVEAARRPARFSAPRMAAAIAWLGLGAVLGFVARDYGPAAIGHTPALARQAALAHAVYSPEVRHPVEVGADQEAHLVAWLSKRLGSPVKAPHLQAAGFDLVGGRLLPGDAGPVAQFMYQDGRGQRLTLYVRSNPGAEGETAFRFAQEGRIGVFYWLDGPLGYALSGEVDKAELLTLADLVYKQLNP